MTVTTPSNETGIYLVVQVESGLDVAVACTRLSKTASALPVEAVLLSGFFLDNAIKDEPALTSLIETAQKLNCAAMISDDANLAQSLKADGIHLNWRPTVTADFAAARAKAAALMIGAEAGKSRHDAMVLAEAGADYIGFGVPTDLKDQETARARQIELVSWWSELFEVPVVAFDMHTSQQAQMAKDAGADFLAVTMPPNSTDESSFDHWLEDFAQVVPGAAHR